jgi:DNA repair protein RecO (recombination protein O)
MATYATRAVVLRLHKLGESDRIVTMLASDGRQIRAVAKGSRKGTSRLAGRLQPYAVVDLLMATGRSLDVVSEAETRDAHERLRTDLDRSAAAGSVTELAERLSTDGTPEARVYDLTVATLTAVETAPDTAVTLLVAAYYAKSLAMHGWRPQLLTCAACSAEVGEGYLSASEGGVLCSSCAGRDPAAVRLSAEAHALLRVLIGATLADLARADVDPALTRDTLVLLREFATWHLGARLRAVDFLLGVPPPSPSGP